MKNNVFVSMQEECEPPSWFEKVEPFVLEILEKLELNHWELSVMFCKDSFIHELNKQYRKIDSPTDVLSFEIGEEMGEGIFQLGEVAVNIDQAERQAKEYENDLEHEIAELVEHGTLHLLGVNHVGDM